MKKIWTVIGCLCILAGIIASLVFYEPVQPAGHFIWAAFPFIMTGLGAAVLAVSYKSGQNQKH